jgi:hypothetical protein
MHELLPHRGKCGLEKSPIAKHWPTSREQSSVKATYPPGADHFLRKRWNGASKRPNRLLLKDSYEELERVS